MLGREPASLVGVLVGDLSVDADRSEELRLGNELFAGTRSRFEVDKRMRHASGEAIPCRVHISLVRDESGAPRFVVAVVVDLREQNELASLRERAAESRAVRGMAARLAHDFGNALSVVMLERMMLEETISVGGDTRPHVQAIGEASDTSARLVSQLRLLASVGPSATSCVDLTATLREQRASLRREVGSERRFVLQVPGGPAWVPLDRASLDRILRNLLLNAVEAPPAGGTVAVTVAPCRRGWQLAVIDDGVGMKPEIRERSLEPFFGTRDGGTGLGLSVVQGIVTTVGGTVRVVSRPGEGARVEIDLPSMRREERQGAGGLPEP